MATKNYEGPFNIFYQTGHTLEWRPWNRITNALQIACGFRDEKLVKALLIAGADVNDDDFSYSQPRTPLGFSLEQQKLDKQIYEVNGNIVNTLLQHGALLGCLQVKRSCDWQEKDLCTIFEKLSSRKQITIPENAIENAVNYILFITKPSNDFLWWLRRDPTWDNFYFLFYLCDNEWIYHLCNMIHNHIKNEEKRNDLLLKLCSIKIKNDEKKTIDQHIIKSIVANNNKTFFETLKKEESYDTYCIKGSNALLSFVYQKNDKVFAKQLYTLYQNKNINLDKMWENAATMKTACLKTLLKLSSNPLEVLRKKSNDNQTIFYLAITHNDSFREKALQYVTKHLEEPEIFLTQEVNNAIEIKECTKLDIFLQFYKDNELQNLIQPVAQTAKLQYDLLCYQHQQNLSICKPSRELQLLESVYSKFQTYI